MNDAAFEFDIYNGAEILVTSAQVSLTEIINVSCTISPPVHSSSPPTSSKSPPSSSKPSKTALDKSTVANATSSPTEKAVDPSTLHVSTSYSVHGLETQSVKVKVTAASSPSSASKTSVTSEPTKTRSPISYVTPKTTFFIATHDQNNTSTESSISKASEKQDSFKFTIVAIVLVIYVRLLFQGIFIAILYRKKKRNLQMPPTNTSSGMRIQTTNKVISIPLWK